MSGCLALVWAMAQYRAEWMLLTYLLPIGLVAAALTGFVWIRRREETGQLNAEITKVRALSAQIEHERDVAQEELFRRLYEERELNKEKAQFQAQLADFEKYAALARLALGAAHEINNPLLGILSHLELELKACQGVEERIEIEQCIAGARRISSTLRGLVNYARPGPLMLTKINLGRLVSDTLNFLEGQPMLRGKTLDNQVGMDLPLLRADANQLSQVLMNLLLNAAEATGEGGSILISAAKLTYVDSLEVSVGDTGCGIAPEILPHIFEPFYTTKKGKGTGLGLSISQAYVRSHHGEIRVDSVPERGTTITITLPLHPQSETGEPLVESEVLVS